MKTVVLCGSKKFKPEMRNFAKRLRALGVDVFEPHLTQMDWPSLGDDVRPHIAAGLTYDHFQKIRMADVVYLYNKDGYAGVSVTLEVGYAAALAKPIFAMSDQDDEWCRRILIHEVVTTPEELIQRLH